MQMRDQKVCLLGRNMEIYRILIPVTLSYLDLWSQSLQFIKELNIANP